MKKGNNEPIIIEDCVYCEYRDGRTKSLAKHAFCYQFFLDHADDKKYENCAEAFLAYQAIYLHLLRLGILNNTDYVIKWVPLDGGASFTFDLSKAQEELDIEYMLNDVFGDTYIGEYVEKLFHPEDSFRCDYCGAITFSIPIIHQISRDRCIRVCLQCNPYQGMLLPVIQKRKENGPYEAVNLRIKLIEKDYEDRTVPNKDNEELILDFINDHDTLSAPNPKIQVAEKILERAGIDDLLVFGYYDNIGLINMRAACINRIFEKIVSLNEDGTIILGLWDKPGVVYLGDNCIKFLKKLCDDSELIGKL